MKQETKKKLCKISKIVGFAITFGFAVFGALCAAMLIGNGSKKDDIKTLDSSLVQNEVRSERNSKPRKAPDYSGAVNLLEDISLTTKRDASIFVYDPNFTVIFGGQGNNSLYLTDYLPKGVYYMETNTQWFFMPKNSAYEDIMEGMLNPLETRFTASSALYDEQFGPYVKDGSNYFYSSGDGCVFAREVGAQLYLVDTLELPPSSSISFPDSFSPLGLFGDSVTNNGGYVYLPQAQGNVLSLEITGLIFKYGGVVYDGIHIECVRALSIGYINDDGQLVPQGGTEDYLWALSWIKFYQRYKGQTPQNGIVVVMPELKSVSGNAGPVAFTGRTQWVNRSDRTIQIIDDLGITTGRYDGRYTNMTDKQLMEWVSSSFSIGNSLGVMGNNSVFDIFTNAFDSVLPILSIAILPNITLGMLLFIPLIGAIIVIIIRVVKK